MLRTEGTGLKVGMAVQLEAVVYVRLDALQRVQEAIRKPGMPGIVEPVVSEGWQTEGAKPLASVRRQRYLQ